MASVNKVIVDSYLAGKSTTQLSAAFGIPVSNVRYALKKAGVLRSRSDAIRLAASVGRLGSGNRGKKRTFSEEWKQNISRAKTAAADSTAKGVSKKPNGYLEHTRGEHKGRSVHVVVMEQALGRRLHENECVHHRDENKLNNEFSNLELMTRSQHAAHHAKLHNFGR